MSLPERTCLDCPSCGAIVEMTRWTSVNTALDPDVARALLDGSLTAYRCVCGHEGNVDHDVLFHDPVRRQMIQVAVGDLEATRGALLHAFEGTAGFGEHLHASLATRVVRSRGGLVEKVRLAAAGLDDRVWEALVALLAREPGGLQGRTIAFEGVDGDALFVTARDGDRATFSFSRGPYDELAASLAAAGALGPTEPWAVVDRGWATALFARLASD